MQKYRIFPKFLVVLWLLSTPLFGATYYVNKSGNDSNSCATATSATDTDAKLTVQAGIDCLAAADTLLIGDGTYVEAINDIPSGTNEANRTFIKCENDRGEGRNAANCYLKQSSGTQRVEFDRSFITFDSIGFDGADTASTVTRIDWDDDNTGAKNVTFEDVECKNSNGSGCLVFREHTEDNIVQNSWVHDNGTPPTTTENGVYSEGINTTIQDNIIETTAMHGILVKGDDGQILTGIVIRRNILKGNGDNNFSRGGGLFLARLSDAKVYNNILEDNNDGLDIVGSLLTGVKLWNNTIVDSGDYGIQISSGNTSTEIRNNISWGSGAQAIKDDGVTTVLSNNLKDVDPLFTNEASSGI